MRLLKNTFQIIIVREEELTVALHFPLPTAQGIGTNGDALIENGPALIVQFLRQSELFAQFLIVFQYALPDLIPILPVQTGHLAHEQTISCQFPEIVC